MLAFVVGCVVALAVFAGTVRLAWEVSGDCYGGRHWGEVAFGVFAGAALGAAGFAGGGFLTIAVANAVFDHDDRYRSVELVALRDGTGQQGQYVWGSGAASASANYVFYHRDGDAKRLVNIEASSVRLYEDSPRPYAIQFTGCDLSVAWVAPCFHEKERFVEIHVPPGSVVDTIDLSLNGG